MERNKLRKEARHAKASSSKAYFDKIETGSEAARLNRMLAFNPEAWVGALKLDDGGYTNCADETLMCLMKSNFPGCIRDLRLDANEEEVGRRRTAPGTGRAGLPSGDLRGT